MTESDSGFMNDTRSSAGADELIVVGIGASAGGLEALEELFADLPVNTGAAFVVVQHLSPDFRSRMPELLARRTGMAVTSATDGMPVQADRVYLVPPGTDIMLEDLRLRLQPRATSSGPSHPIDRFFQSLSSDIGKRSAGVILSGTGSDGSRGIVDIERAGGLVLVQDPATAAFDGMPRNAVATGAVHAVLPPTNLADALAEFIRDGVERESLRDLTADRMSSEELTEVFRTIREHCAVDFSQYKSGTVERRIHRRMTMAQIAEIPAYAELLERDPAELNELCRDLLIGMTSFFRDRNAFESLQTDVIAPLFDGRPDSDPIRVWVPGCSTGEEAYSLAMLLDEERTRSGQKCEIKVFATDANPELPDIAARGVYSRDSLSAVSKERRERYFSPEQDGWRVSADLRRMIVFARHNMLSDAPFTQLDLVSCRNLLIYLRPEIQKKALSLFHFSLRTGGILFLGPSETTGDLADEFDVVSKRWRIYRKRRDVRIPVDTGTPALRSVRRTGIVPSYAGITPAGTVTAETLAAYDRLLARFVPMSVLIDTRMHIMHVFGGAEEFLRLRSGRPTNNLAELTAEHLKQPIRTAVQQALRTREPVRIPGLTDSRDGSVTSLSLAVHPMTTDSGEIAQLLVEFRPSDSAPSRDSSGSMPTAASERSDSAATENNARQIAAAAAVSPSAAAETEYSAEALQAVNEELLTSNEELQSTNEELQSVNEELHTVNAEYQRRVEELARSNDDMDNLLATTRVGVLFLDDHLCIRRFTPEMAKLLQLMPQDVGRSIRVFAHHLSVEDPEEVIREVLNTESEREMAVSVSDANHYLLRMQPYRSGPDVHGVVLTLIDIRSLKEAEVATARFQSMVESARDAVTLVAPDGRFLYINPATAEMSGYTREALLSMTVFDLNTEMTPDRFRALFESARADDATPFEAVWKCSDESLLPVEISVSLVRLGNAELLSGHIRSIEDRVHAEMEERIRLTALEAVNNGIVVVDATHPQLPITYASRGFLRITGYDEADVVGKNCRFLQGPDTDPEAVGRLRVALREGKPIRITLRNYRRDGTPFWNDLQINPIFDAFGELRHFVGVQNDVTDQVEAVRASRYEAEHVTDILNTVADGIYGVDEEGRCVFCNSQAVSLLGFDSPEELIGRNMHSLIHHHRPDGSELPKSECRIYQALRENRETRCADEVFFRKDGSAFPVDYTSRALVRDGKVVGAVVTFEDITHRLAIAGQLEQLGAMFDASHDAMVVWELDGVITQWNRGAEELYGFTAEESVGRVTHNLLKTAHPDGWDDVRATLLAKGAWVGELSHRTRSGDSVVVSSRQQLVRSRDGHRVVLEVNRDVTEQYRIREELRDAIAAAETANDAKSRFLANVSHELRTPMTAVLGFAEMLQEALPDDDSREKLSAITRNGKYLLRLLNDLLDLSQIEADKLHVAEESVSIPKLIDDLAAMMKLRAEDEGIGLTFEVLSKVPMFITADRVRVRQILVNLIGNALKFSDTGTVRVLVDTVDESENSALRIRVIDTGIGISEEQQTRLFQPFSQADEDTGRRYGGTGLGLSISRRLAELMGGSIAVDSRLNEGSCFTLCLPISSDQGLRIGTPVPADYEPEETKRSPIPAINARILLADDRRDIWRVARFFLERAGGSVEVAEDGRQAVDAWKRAAEGNEPFDVILMDMQMPVMTGQEAVAELRSSGCGVPIIALTADAMEGEQDACLQIGCDDYVPKPIDGRRLVRTVHRMLETGRSDD